MFIVFFRHKALFSGPLQNKAFKEVGQETQVYHYSNEGGISWHEFAKEILEMAGLDCKVSPIITEQYPTLAKRPKSVLMNKDKIIQKFFIEIPSWKKSLKSFMK